MNRCQDCGNIHPIQPCAAQPTKFLWPYEGKVVLIFGSWNQFQVGNQINSKQMHLKFASWTI